MPCVGPVVAAAKKPAKTAAKKSTPKAAQKAAAKTAPAPAPAPAAAPPAASASMSGDPMYPIVDRTPWGILALVLGILALGGVGTIIAGVISKRHMTRDIIIGVLQLVIPFLGWAWGLVWGILIFVKGNK